MQDGQLSLLVGEGRATYSRPVNGSVSYNTAGGQFGGQYGQPGNPSFMTQQRDGYDMVCRLHKHQPSFLT